MAMTTITAAEARALRQQTADTLDQLRADGVDGEFVDVAARLFARQCKENPIVDGEPVQGDLLEGVRTTDVAHGCGVPMHLVRLCADGQIEDWPAVRAVEAAQEATTSTLVLYGGPGVGKSVAAAWVVWGRALDAIAATDRPAHYADVRELSERHTWHQTDRDTIRTSRDRVRRAPLLVLDDLGHEPCRPHGPWWCELRAILQVRSTAPGKCTIITTSLSVEGLRARYGQDIAHRMLDGDRTRLVGVAAPKKSS